MSYTDSDLKNLENVDSTTPVLPCCKLGVDRGATGEDSQRSRILGETVEFLRSTMALSIQKDKSLSRYAVRTKVRG